MERKQNNNATDVVRDDRYVLLSCSSLVDQCCQPGCLILMID
jgi:hypothetical protein